MSASLRLREKAPKILTSLCARRLRLGLNLAAVDERDRRIEDQPVSRLDAAVHFDPRAEIALHFHLAELCLAIVDEGDLHSATVEDDRIGRHQEAWRLARDEELDRAVDARSQRAVGIGD